MRVLLVHGGADLYGASRSLLRLTSRLVRDGNNVMAVLPFDGPLQSELLKSGVEVVMDRDLPVVTRGGLDGPRAIASLLTGLPVSVSRLRKLIREFHADLVHTNTALILSPGIAARLAGAPHVWHVRESFAEFSRHWRWYQWYMYSLADVIVCVSGAMAAQYAKRIRKRKVVVIHNGFPKDEFTPPEEARVNAFRERFGLNGRAIVGVIGRIKFARKGQEVFVRAAALLKDRYPGVQFALVGSPYPGNEEHLRRLQELIQSLGLEEDVVYTGEVEDVKAAYAALDISVLPSALPEPFGGVVIESMAMGKPVVGTRLGGTVEQIEEGVTGFLVPPGDPNELAAALARLLSDPDLRRRMGENGRKRFLEMFEFEPFYGKICRLYENLIHKDSAT